MNKTASISGIEKCKLCKHNDATVTGSHFVSACIVEDVYGERGSEDAYDINLRTLKVKNYKGPSNTNNTDTTLQENFIVANYVFCKECEGLFGILENECCYPVRQNLMDLKNGIKKIERTNQGNKYFVGEKLKKMCFNTSFTH